MNDLFRNFTKTLVVFNFALTGCQKATPESSHIKDDLLAGLTTSADEISEFKSRWTEKDAQDFADYVSIKIESAPDVKALNHGYISTSDSQENTKDMTPQNIHISGVIVVMDATALPFTAYGCSVAGKSACRRNIHSLKVEADKIIIRGVHKFPQTKVTLVANEVVLEKDAAIDVTPLGFLESPPPLAIDSQATSGHNGKVGEAGSSISIYSNSLDIKGDISQPRFIANGGPR